MIATSPLLGAGLDRALVPAETQVLGAADLSRAGAPDLIGALATQIAGVNLDSASGNPFQPSLFYNGFEVSPLQGTSQGLAVYANGIRFNSAFGDTVNWDLIPDAAIARVNVEGSNPLFGLNALGGAINVALKDGFGAPGGRVELSGGSFGQVQADAQYGVQSGGQALYAAGSVTHQDGWRDLQASDIQNFFADYGVRHNGVEIHLDLNLANSIINGPGTSPVQLLAADPAAQFTAPNAVANRYVQTALRANAKLADVLSLQTQIYSSYFQQRVANGNTTNDLPCGNGSALLCQAPGVPSLTRGGVPILDYLHGGPYSQLDTQTTNTNAYGAAIQLTDTGTLFGLANHFVAGASLDGAQTLFSATAFLGGLNRITRIFEGPGVALDEPGSTIPVRVAIANDYAGAYASDTLNVTRALAVTLSARYNFAEIDLADQEGGDLSGRHAYRRLNPAAGATYRLTDWLSAYAGYAEANRAPTPAELSCAGPQNTCSLANFFVGDPDLKQVSAHTIEAGLRGHLALDETTRLGYDLSLFNTDADNDIVFINSPVLNRAYFANVGQTRRRGVSARIDLKAADVTAYAAYTYTGATFQTGYVEAAQNNPAADAAGNITILRGDMLPGVARNTFKLGVEAELTPTLSVGADGLLQSGQVLFGDEANATPRLPGFFTLDLHASYRLTPRLTLFADGRNVLDRRYYTFGTFAPTSSVFLAQAPGVANPRSYTLAAPAGLFAGVRLTFK